MPQLLPDTESDTATVTDGPVIDADGPTGTVVVEGPTASEALEEVHRRHGAGARIINAEKVLKGGIGGFFAKEVVQLTVDPGTARDEAPAAPRSSAVGSSGTPVFGLGADASDPHADETFGEMLDRRAAAGVPNGGLAGVVAELTSAAESRESTFGDALRAAIGSTTSTPQRPAPTRESIVTGTPADRLSSLLGVHGAGALVSDSVATATLPTQSATPARGSGSEEEQMERAEARLDAAVRAVAAGTTAAKVVRAAESGDLTRFAPTEFATESTSDPEPEPAPFDPVLDRAPAPAPERPAEPTFADHVWSADGLLRLGLPASMVAAIIAQRPTDDMAWFSATARVIAPLCGPLPEGPEIAVGPRARGYAKAAEIKVTTLDGRPARRSSFALATRATERAKRFLEREQRGRWLNLVVGGASWREWLWERPSCVSWTEDAELPTALDAAATLDLVLGHVATGGTLQRANPVDLTYTIRRLLETR